MLLTPLVALHTSEKHATCIAAEEHVARHGLKAANVAISPAVESAYRGWKTVWLSNGLIDLHVLPEIGGRIIQFKLGGKEFLWVNPQLTGKLPPSNGLASDGSWFNIGGDKLWPAPQGWDNDRQWPGPPDAVLDGLPYALEKLPSKRGETAVRLTSGKDRRSGIQFSRSVRVFEGSTRVGFEATMTNIDTRPRRWGIWAHTQLDGRKADGAGHNALLNAWCPLNPRSKFPAGYDVIFGAKNNPSFQPDRARGLMRVEYQYKVGKIGLDSRAGWIATVDGASGAAFVQRFVFEPEKEYPDGASVEFWLNGVGRIHAYNRDMVMPSNAAETPYVFESEVLSPFAELQPGQSYTWRYDWYAANIGGNFSVVDCSDAGVVAEPLSAEWSSGQTRLKGRWGVFTPGTLRAEFADARGRRLQSLDLPLTVSPTKPVVLDTVVATAADAASVKLVLIGAGGTAVGELAKADLRKTAPASRWPAEKAWQWYNAQPWIVGFNYIPATAINTTEMWQADTFDPKTIDAELALAKQVGFNSARVFLQYLVWEDDPTGLKQRLEKFLAIADKHGIRTMFVLFDDCNFSPYSDPFLGKQPELISGRYAHAWTPSPGPKYTHNRGTWPKLEQYVKDVVGAFSQDKRVLAWETWNEPLEDRAPLELVEASFRWARQAKPSQPVAATVFGSVGMQELVGKLSDVVSFHNYSPAAFLESEIKDRLALGRPVLCTEWMFRPYDSVPATCLPVLAKYRVAAFHWGLVNGKTQTHLHMRPTGKPSELWQHDIFRKDHTSYDPKELAVFRDTIRQSAGNGTTVEGQWSAGKAWAWYSCRPWLVGCNFLPSTAVNDVEMWQKATFDAATIDRELGWARQLGFNTVRVFLNYVVWQNDVAGLKTRFAEFLKIADRHGISVMPILLDDCNFAGRVAAAGKQSDPVPGVHNSQWVSSPPLAMVTDRSAWPALEQYVKDVVKAFGQDRRIVVWDLYNEPGNGMGDKSRPLMEAAFAWAREAKPSQPLTTGAWADFTSPFSRRMMELSDIVSFHGYDPPAEIEAKLKICAAHGRPVLCTEWLVRRGGNSVERLLPLFRDRKIGCWNWGLVAGRTQTYFPWGSPQGAPEPQQWQHDILRADGRPFSAREVQFIKVITGRLPASALPLRTVLIPTAEKAPVPWRYTLEKPADGWFKPDFNDAAWKQGAAPFGTNEPEFARKPNTDWRSAELWARRDFEMPPGRFTDLALLLHYDEDATVYINGVPAVTAAGYNASYEPFDITPQAQAALKPGKNTIAVHCRQTGGGQYFDLGIEGVAAK